MKQLLILSGKGGTGKTTVASAFIKLSHAKAFADCDVDAPNLHLVTQGLPKAIHTDYMGMPKAVINPGLCIGCDRCRQHCRFSAIQNHAEHYEVNPYDCEGCGVCVLVCPVDAVSLQSAKAGVLKLFCTADTVFSTAQLEMGSGTSGKLVTEVKKQMVNQSAGKAPLAIIDGSPGIGCPVIASLNQVDLVLIVAEPSVSGISDMRRILEAADRFQVPTAVCINKYNTDMRHSDEIENLCLETGVAFTGRIPFDPAAVRAINSGKSIVDVDCPAGDAVRNVYGNTLRLLEERSDR
ncbi:MAG: ATP-binding protein [Sphaerochaetaceae bacterium]